MEEEDFNLHRVGKALAAVTQTLQVLFLAVWADKYPETTPSVDELMKKTQGKKNRRKLQQQYNNGNVKEWDISKICFFIVDANVLNMKETDKCLTAAIVDIKTLRNEIFHNIHLACNKHECEEFFRHFRDLAETLESDKFKTFIDTQRSPTKMVEDCYSLTKPCSGDELSKIKKEYIDMLKENIRCVIKEESALEKSKLEYENATLKVKVKHAKNELVLIRKRLVIALIALLLWMYFEANKDNINPQCAEKLDEIAQNVALIKVSNTLQDTIYKIKEFREKRQSMIENMGEILFHRMPISTSWLQEVSKEETI